MFAALILAAALGAAADPVGASPTASAEPAKAAVATGVSAGPSAPVQKAKVDRIVCQDVETTGSHMSDRVCMRQSEWDQQARDGADGAIDTARHASAAGILPH